MFAGISSADYLDYKYRYSNPSFSSYGTTGLVQMPNARFHKEGSLALVYSDFDPYARLAMIAYPFSWLELYYQYTDITNKLYSDVFAYSGNQTYKDKGFDIKIKLLNESVFLPSLAVGFRDLAGTGIFSSEFLVASKQINNIDLTLGMGWGNLSNNKFDNPLSDLSKRFDSRSGFAQEGGFGGEISTSSFFRGPSVGIFGGAEYIVPFTKGLKLKIEYDSTNYDEEGFFSINAKSDINYGVSYSLNKFLNLNFGYIRGNTLQFGFSISGDFGKKNPIIPKTEKHKPIKNSYIARSVNATNTRLLYLSTLKNLNERKLPPRMMNLSEDGSKYSVSFAQSIYISYPQAYGRVARVLHELAPDSVKEFELIPMNAGFELLSINIPRKDFAENVKSGNAYALSEKIEVLQKPNGYVDTFEYQPKRIYPANFYSIGPGLESHIGGPSKFFEGGLSILANLETLLSENTNFQAVFKVGIFNSFDNIKQKSSSVLPHVRTDLVEYLKESQNFAISRAQFNHFSNPYKSFYTKLSVGIFEDMFGGYGGEFLYKPYDKNWAIGFDAYRVRQRTYEQRLKFFKNGRAVDKYETTTGHLTLYFEEPRSQVLFKLLGGKYLAGDSGITIDMSRRFKSGLRMGGFFSLTDISKEEFGEGSFNKGFYINFPIQAFFSNHSRGLVPFGLTPLTRDGAAKLYVGHDLYGVTDQGSYQSFLRDKYDLYD